jgi:4-amino-4-deoxy-L-arabinose transferase-like glycosyltransferase
MKKFYQQNKSFLIIFIVMAAYFIQHLISLRFGLHFEETRGANAYLLATRGFLPYRDFEWGYGPFAFFIYPFLFKIFGVHLLVLRLSYIIFASLVIPLTYFLARRIMPHLWAGVAAFLSVVFFDVPYYTVNHIFAVLGELACLLMICRFYESDKKSSCFLVWAGIFAAIAILTKPLLAGVSLAGCVFLFLLFVESGPLLKRLKNYSVFLLTSVSLILPYAVYFYFRTRASNIPVTHSYFAKDSALFVDLLIRIRVGEVFLRFLRRFMGMFPVNQLLNISSFTELKRVFIFSFDNFIFILPFMAAFIIFLSFLVSKPKKRGHLLLFAIFSVLIAVESLIITHKLGRAFILQVPFILTAYMLYLIKGRFHRRPAITTSLIILFLFYLSFLHFFRYPYSMIKRCTQPLNLARAGGILVSPEEKEMYESLSSYLSDNFTKKDKMAVACYYPQFGFLTKQRNIFEDEEWIFAKLSGLSPQAAKSEKKKLALAALEDKIMAKMQREEPKIILAVTDDPFSDFGLRSSRVSAYIEKRYSLDRVFGPADVEGLGGGDRWVKLYKYNRQKGKSKR